MKTCSIHIVLCFLLAHSVGNASHALLQPSLQAQPEYSSLRTYWPIIGATATIGALGWMYYKKSRQHTIEYAEEDLKHTAANQAQVAHNLKYGLTPGLNETLRNKASLTQAYEQGYRTQQKPYASLLSSWLDGYNYACEKNKDRAEAAAQFLSTHIAKQKNIPTQYKESTCKAHNAQYPCFICNSTQQLPTSNPWRQFPRDIAQLIFDYNNPQKRDKFGDLWENSPIDTAQFIPCSLSTELAICMQILRMKIYQPKVLNGNVENSSTLTKTSIIMNYPYVMIRSALANRFNWTIHITHALGCLEYFDETTFKYSSSGEKMIIVLRDTDHQAKRYTGFRINIYDVATGKFMHSIPTPNTSPNPYCYMLYDDQSPRASIQQNTLYIEGRDESQNATYWECDLNNMNNLPDPQLLTQMRWNNFKVFYPEAPKPKALRAKL